MDWLSNLSQIAMVVLILLIPYFVWSFIRRSVRNYMMLKEEELELQRENNKLLRQLNGLSVHDADDINQHEQDR